MCLSPRARSISSTDAAGRSSQASVAASEIRQPTHFAGVSSLRNPEAHISFYVQSAMMRADAQIFPLSHPHALLFVGSLGVPCEPHCMYSHALKLCHSCRPVATSLIATQNTSKPAKKVYRTVFRTCDDALHRHQLACVSECSVTALPG